MAGFQTTRKPGPIRFHRVPLRIMSLSHRLQVLK
jgi:hypothetical protein